MASSEIRIVYSTLSADNRTVLPRAVRERLRLRPGDWLRFLVGVEGVSVERYRTDGQDACFSTFSEMGERRR